MATLAPPRPTEVRCAGCSETLEVDPGLTEFICPDCDTPQTLPPELMPRKRKALPLKMQLPCGSCAALLNVPHGLARFGCPKCGVELAVDQERLKGYLAGASVDAGEVAAVVPSAVRLPPTQINVTHQTLRAPVYSPAAEIERNYVTTPRAPRVASRDLEHQVNVTDQPLRAPIYSQAGNSEQNHVANPRVPRAASIDIEHEDLTPVSSGRHVFSSVNTIDDSASVPSRGLISSSINNTNNNMHTTIPASMTPVHCRLNIQQTEEEEPAEEREETVPTPSLIKRTASKGNPEQNPKVNKKQSSGLKTKELENSLRRSKRLSQSSPPTNKKQKSHQSQPTQSQSSQSQPIQSQLSEDNETPLDIARHYNNLFPLDNDPLWNPVSPIPDPVSPIPDPDPPLTNPGTEIPDLSPQDGDMNSEDDNEEGDKDYVAESDSGQSEPDSSHEPEPDSSHEPEPESVLEKALRDAQERRGFTPGKKSKKPKKSKTPTPQKQRQSKYLDIWDRSEDNLIEIEFNNVGQPIGEMAYALSNFLGSIARDGQLVPINYKGWKQIPAKNKDVVWYIVKSKFKMQPANRKYVMQKVARIWINWKSKLKNMHYDVHDNDEARLADIDKRIEPEQWPFLVNFWSSDEGKKRSEINKAARAKQRTYHSMGRKSFARIREEERLKRKDMEEPSRAEMFILTHTRKDGTPVDEESGRIIARIHEELAKAPDSSASSSKSLKNDILAKVLGGNEKRITTYGLLPTRPDNWSPPPDPEERARIIREAKKLADEESMPMKEQMEAMEKRHKEMEMEMQVMRQAMLAMSGMAPPGFGGSSQGGDAQGGVSDREGSLS